MKRVEKIKKAMISCLCRRLLIKFVLYNIVISAEIFKIK